MPTESGCMCQDGNGAKVPVAMERTGSCLSCVFSKQLIQWALRARVSPPQQIKISLELHVAQVQFVDTFLLTGV